MQLAALEDPGERVTDRLADAQLPLARCSGAVGGD
jgi:hypothetical protein